MSPTTATQDTRKTGELYMALELSSKTWKLASSDGTANPRLKSVDARDVIALTEEVKRARARFGLHPKAPVRTCYEAGRDAFWLHRALGMGGIHNLVVDSASIEVNRRARRRKTDRLDARKLLAMLVRYHRGEQDVWRVVHAPSEAAEDARVPHRELERLKKERTALRNYARGSLARQGIHVQRLITCLKTLDRLRRWDGKPLPPNLLNELKRLWTRLELVNTQIRELEREREKAVKTSDDKQSRQIRTLALLRGVGWKSASLLVYEFFGWRKFRNRREVGALAGLTGTPYQSGGSQRDQGISKAGNRRVRTLMIQLAWGWLRFQPDSKLTKWYQERFAAGSSRTRRVGIVALARKLLIRLWRLLQTGTVPDGAQLKEA